MPDALQPPTRHRPQGKLSSEIVVDAAIVLIERDGADALTMRRLGSELSVEAMSLYNHVAGRDELLRAIAERLLQPLRDVALDGSWSDCAQRYADGVRAVALERPVTFALVGFQPLRGPAALASVERFLAALIARGFAPAGAIATYRAIVSFARGYALAEATGFTVDASTAETRAELRSLPEAGFPVLQGSVDALGTLDADAGFQYGLTSLLAGLPGPDG